MTRRGPSRSTKLAFSAGLTLIGFVFVELVARLLFGSPAPESFANTLDTLQRYNRGCAELVPAEDGSERLVMAGFGDDPQRKTSAPLEKPAGVRRIILLGESTGEMLGYHLREHLGDADAPRRPDVQFMGCAIAGMNVAHLGPWIEEVFAYEPDVVLLVYGHNTGFRVPERATSPAWLTLWGIAMHTHLTRFLARVPDTGAVSEAEYAAQVETLEGRLERLVALARAHGTRLVVATMASNPRFAPDPHSEATHSEGHWRRALRRDQGRPLPDELAWNPGAPHGGGLWPYLDGMSRLEQGDAAGARERLADAVEHDPRGARARRSVNAILSRGDGWEVLALGGMVEAASKVPVPAWDVFWDDVHPRPEVLHQVAWDILATLDARPDSPSACRERPEGDGPWIEEHPRLRGEAGHYFQRAGFTDRIATALQEGRLTPDEVRARVESVARAGGPVSHEIVEDASLALSIAGEPDAGLALLGLLPDPETAEAAFVRARVQLRAHRDGEARVSLERVLALDPGHLGARVYLNGL